MFTQKPVCAAYSGFVYNSPKLVTTQMLFNRWMNGQTVVCPPILLFKPLIQATTLMTLQRIMLSEKKPILKGCVLCDPNYVYSEWQNDGDECISSSQWFRRKEGRGEVGVAITGQFEESLCWCELPGSSLYQCQFPGCDTVLQFCKIFSLGEGM